MHFSPWSAEGCAPTRASVPLSLCAETDRTGWENECPRFWLSQFTINFRLGKKLTAPRCIDKITDHAEFAKYIYISMVHIQTEKTSEVLPDILSRRGAECGYLSRKERNSDFRGSYPGQTTDPALKERGRARLLLAFLAPRQYFCICCTRTGSDNCSATTSACLQPHTDPALLRPGALPPFRS